MRLRKHYKAFLLLQLILYVSCDVGMLFPRDSESRTVKLLDGIWKFKTDSSPSRNNSFVEAWWEKSLAETGPTIDIPVPSSYNDVTQDKNIRDFVGWAWYERTFFVPSDWANKRIVLRFDSAHYFAKVWVNGKFLMEHDGGHLPFEAMANNVLLIGGKNRLTVAVNNTLLPTTLPPGSLEFNTKSTRYPPGYFVQNLQMDFFNYAGIHRHVALYATPHTFIDDITILTDIDKNQALVHYDIVLGGARNATLYNLSMSVVDDRDVVVAKGSSLRGDIIINNPTLWWPFGMNSTVGYQYTLEVKVNGDVYRQPFGIRTVKITPNDILINSKPFYCHGVAKHEDSDLRGKGLDYTLIVKDFNMLRWLGVNCIRTSHYPYAEEILEMCDRQGIAVINESPGVGIHEGNFGPVSLAHHIEVMSEMIRRDKNKPSVIIWSVANEPQSHFDDAIPYFKAVMQNTRETDPAHRPVTLVMSDHYGNDQVNQYSDVLCLNRYFGWYSDTGHTEVIKYQMMDELEAWRNRYPNLPIIVTEYGADTIAGMHRDPSFVFTEEFQEEFLSEYHSVFDQVDYLVGEMVWNFADFMTVQGTTRVVGNKKGLLTRQRQPKRAAFLIRQRYWSMVNHTDTATMSCSKYAKSKQSNMPHNYVHS